MDTYLVSRMSPGTVDAFIEQVETSGSSFLGPQYTTKVVAVVNAKPVSTVVTIARNKYNPADELFAEGDGLFYVFSGYTVDDVTDGRRVSDYFGKKPTLERPILRSPGGIYSYVTIRRSDGQVCAGHSTPTLEPVYYSESLDGLHIGNNPLLVHAAARSFQAPQVNPMFFFASVSAGVAIDDSTPFLGCYRVPPRKILVNTAGGLATHIVDAPRPTFGNYGIANFQQRKESVAEALIQAGSVLTRLPRGELRVSGGKDSRLVAAYIKHAGIEVVPINQNLPAEVEGQVADMVARHLGAEACIRVPLEDLKSHHDIQRAVRRKVAFAGGLPAVAALQYPTRSEGSAAGIPLIMGHAHLQRGGFIGRIRKTREALATASSRTVSPFLRPAFGEQNLQQVRNFVNESLARDDTVPQAVSFLAYLEYPMNYQFQSLYAYVRNWNVMITPLVDERFALLCEEIAYTRASSRSGEYAGITDLHNESIAMGATQTLAPDLLRFPLAEARYRCDGPHWPDFPLRDPDLIQPMKISSGDLERIFDPRKIKADLRRSLWEHIESTVVAPFAEAACNPVIWRYISEPDSAVPAGEHRTLLNQFLWSVYGLSVILGSDWWEELAAT
jgi:hypothetical protein